MGFLSSLFGGGKPKKQEAGADEKAQAVSAYRAMRRLEQKFFPLQEQMAEEANKDFSNHFKGSANADLAMAEKAAMDTALRASGASGQHIGSAGGLSRLAQLGRDTASAYGETQAKGQQRGLALQDTRKLGISGVGHGLASDAGRAMSTLAKNEMSRGMSTLHARQQVDAARAQALGQVIGTAGTMAAMTTSPSPSRITQRYNSALDQGKAGAGAYAVYR